MKIKLSDQGKKNIADVLSNVLITAQSTIENYIKNTPAISTDDPDIDFTQPDCHLCGTNLFVIADSLNNSFFLSSVEAIIPLKAILLFPVKSPETAHNNAITIAVAKYPRLVPDALRPAVEKCLAQCSMVASDTDHNFVSWIGYESFKSVQYSYAPETQLCLTIMFRVQLAETDYTPV